MEVKEEMTEMAQVRVSDLPDELKLTSLGEGRFDAFQPATSAEGRDVVFSGQYIAQMLMAAEAMEKGDKSPRSIHALFARASSYTKPLELQVEVVQSGRTWGTDAITAHQEGKVRASALVLMTSQDPDLIRHQPAMPDVPAPDRLTPKPSGLLFPGADWRPAPEIQDKDGLPILYAWHRFDRRLKSQAANQAVLSWSTCGHIIGLAFSAHRGKVDLGNAHRTLSTGVIGQTIHFLESFDVSEWLLFTHIATKAANGRAFGRGQIFTQDGRLVGEFAQEAMAKRSETELDYKSAL